MNLGLWGAISPKTILGAIRRGAGGVSDTTAPSVSTFTVTTPSTSRDVPITAFTASEAGVSFIITESSTPPAVGAAGWAGTAPTTYTVAADGTYTLYPWVKDAAGNISAEFASPRTVLVLALPFTDNFTRSDGAIAGQWTGATWTISSNAALNTPTLGSELLPNPGFEGTYENEGTGLDLAPNWNHLNCETDGSDVLAESATAHGGSKSQQINVNANTEGIQTATALLDTLEWYQLSAWVNITSGIAAILDSGAGTPLVASTSITGSWVQLLTTGRLVATGRRMYVRSGSVGANFLTDDASAKKITLASMFATLPDVSVSDVTAQVVIAVNPTTKPAGLVLNLDSTSSPANFVIAYLDGTNAKLDKCVAGTYTNVISGAVTFNAAHQLKLVKDGDNYSLYYGVAGAEPQVGTTQAITSMNGTIHGLFGTQSSITFDNYSLSATP